MRRLSVALIGQPGSGKTTVGKLLAKRLGAAHIDIDDDWLEPRWGCTVGEKLAALGDQAFTKAESNEMEQLEVAPNSVLSMTGSNALCKDTMKSVRRTSCVVLLDTPLDTIQKRAQRMKVDRIVGQADMGLEAVLESRQLAYQQQYDLRVCVEQGDTPEVVCERVERALHVHSSGYVSTRGNSAHHSFQDVVMQGLASDGGLFVPRVAPEPVHDLSSLRGLSFQQLMLRVMEKFPLGGIPPAALSREIHEAYSSFDTPQVMPVTLLHDDVHLVEMFHGPTLSFKDLSLQLLPRLLRLCCSAEDRVGLLVATSGDTGTAALDGFARTGGGNPVAVLYPEGGVSAVQEGQMQTASEDALVLAVRGSDFDACQSFVKGFLSRGVPGVQLSSANSMNWGRFLPQITYALHVYLSAFNTDFDIVYPTGNFGNALGAIEASKLFNLPLRVICASNENNVVDDFIQTGVYDIRGRQFSQTQSPAMDILKSSNLERLLYGIYREKYDHQEAGALVSALYDDLARNSVFRVPSFVMESLRETVDSGWCSDEECVETIRQVHRLTGIIIDPHTAVGYAVGAAKKRRRVPLAVCSTAHFAKFPETVLSALGIAHDAGAPLELLLEKLHGAAAHNEIPQRVFNLMTNKRNHSDVLDLDEVDERVKRYFNT